MFIGFVFYPSLKYYIKISSFFQLLIMHNRQRYFYEPNNNIINESYFRPTLYRRQN